MNTATDIDTDHFGGSPISESPVDRDELRQEVQAKYATVADAPDDDYHFHTGRFIAERCGYDMEAVDALPDMAVESFAGVANPFDLRPSNQGSGSSISVRVPASTASWPPTRSVPTATWSAST